jgi:hypothetical protein
MVNFQKITGYEKNQYPDNTPQQENAGQPTRLGRTLSFFILVTENKWQSSQKGFSIDGNKFLENTQNNRKSGRKT